MFKVIIAGSRSFRDYGYLRAMVDIVLSRKVSMLEDIIIVSGCCPGPDLMGEKYAREKGYLVETHPAQWDFYGKTAGPIRNAEMARNADALIAFWNGRSPGTKNMIDEAEKHGLLIRVFNI